MKKILKFEVEEGKTTSCYSCPFSEDREVFGIKCKKPIGISCDKYDFTTLEFIGEEDV